MARIVARTALLMAAPIALLGIGGRAFGGSRGLVLMVAIGLAINFAHRTARSSRASARA
jgi:hypothetical protein